MNGAFQSDGSTSEWGGIQTVLMGKEIQGAGARNTRVETQMAATEVVRPYPGPVSATLGRLLGEDVNHGTIVWYVFDLVLPMFA